MKMFKIIQEIKQGEMAHPFYGIFRESFEKRCYYAAPIPLNFFIGIFLQIYFFMRYGWFRVCANRFDAYRQGIIVGEKMVRKS